MDSSPQNVKKARAIVRPMAQSLWFNRAAITGALVPDYKIYDVGLVCAELFLYPSLWGPIP